MFERLQKFFASTVGRVFGISFALIGVLAAILIGKYALSNPAIEMSTDRMFMDVSTNKTFPHSLQIGESMPVQAPSGQKTGYPTEKCYWTKDGSIKTDPTYVVLNETLGKDEPTFCPDCGRLVVGNNPMAMAGRKPPITKEDWLAKGYTYRPSR